MSSVLGDNTVQLSEICKNSLDYIASGVKYTVMLF